MRFMIVVAPLVAAIAASCSSSQTSGDASDEWTPEPVLFEECTPSTPKCLVAGKFCWYPEGQCGPQGEDGRCVSQATLSFCDGRPDAVLCGCDGTTYRNECEAQAARVSVRSRGPCP